MFITGVTKFRSKIKWIIGWKIEWKIEWKWLIEIGLGKWWKSTGTRIDNRRKVQARQVDSQLSDLLAPSRVEGYPGWGRIQPVPITKGQLQMSSVLDYILLPQLFPPAQTGLKSQIILWDSEGIPAEIERIQKIKSNLGGKKLAKQSQRAGARPGPRCPPHRASIETSEATKHLERRIETEFEPLKISKVNKNNRCLGET